MRSRNEAETTVNLTKQTNTGVLAIGEPVIGPCSELHSVVGSIAQQLINVDHPQIESECIDKLRAYKNSHPEATFNELYSAVVASQCFSANGSAFNSRFNEVAAALDLPKRSVVSAFYDRPEELPWSCINDVFENIQESINKLVAVWSTESQTLSA